MTVTLPTITTFDAMLACIPALSPTDEPEGTRGYIFDEIKRRQDRR